MKKQIPNILTIMRIVFIPFIIMAIVQKQYLLAVILYTLSSITDVLDGIIARKYNFITDFGKLMDPLADKLTQVGIMATLSICGIIPIWMVLALLLKELIMFVGAAFLYKKRDVVVSSKWYGKVTTVLLYLAVVSSLLIKIFPAMGKQFAVLGYMITFDIVLYVLALIFALFSLLSYVQYFGKYVPKEHVMEEKETCKK